MFFYRLQEENKYSKKIFYLHQQLKPYGIVVLGYNFFQTQSMSMNSTYWTSAKKQALN